MNSSSATFSHRVHQVLLLLEFRPSITSRLRTILLAPGPVSTLAQLADSVPSMITSPCYLTFCSPGSVLLIEKDLSSAVVDFSTEFLAVTNHDKEMESWTTTHWEAALKKGKIPDIGGVCAILDDSVERKECLTNMWKSSTKSRRCSKDAQTWLEVQPVTNECTHFSCIMDPSVDGGGLVWARMHEKAVQMEDSDSLSRSVADP